ncbi:MAG: hypothetical protein E7541_03490 [Ruminococcaceae bacterium]|nr:hypothetical protein [Oscillospiraceae bacterium]
MKKITAVLRLIFGYGIMLCLFAGGLTFFGYLAALIIGGTTAPLICTFLYKEVFPVIIYASTILVLLGLLIMYLCGETALTADKKKSSKHEGEM